MRMDIVIREYIEQDFQEIEEFMEKLQDYLVAIDPLRRLRRNAGYNRSYTEGFLRRVKDGNGMIFLAEVEGAAVGLIGGIIEQQSDEELLACVPSTIGEVIELIVDERFRGNDIGALLMKRMERFFVEKQCDTLWVEVFRPNESAHGFYEKCGYHDRMIGMIKPLARENCHKEVT